MALTSKEMVRDINQKQSFRNISCDFRSTFIDQLGRFSCYNGRGINVLHNDRSRTDYGRTSYFDARPDKGSCSNPALTCDPYWSTDESERSVPVIVPASAEVRLLRYDRMRSNRYFDHEIENRRSSDSTGRLPYTRSDESALSDLRAI
jgi:hypothetical protein